MVPKITARIATAPPADVITFRISAVIIIKTQNKQTKKKLI